MKNALHRKTRNIVLVAAMAAAVFFPAAAANAWLGPVGPGALGWDPYEAYLDEYGFLDPYGPSIGDLRRMQRDRWRAMMGYPVYIGGVGPYGPRPADVIRQYHRKASRWWGYPYAY
jgi:hypothetical protein